MKNRIIYLKSVIIYDSADKTDQIFTAGNIKKVLTKQILCHKIETTHLRIGQDPFFGQRTVVLYISIFIFFFTSQGGHIYERICSS